MESKQYTVVVGKESLFGPTDDYEQVKKFVAKLSPAIKAKCSVQVVKVNKEEEQELPSVQVDDEVEVKPQPKVKPVAEKSKAMDKVVNADKVFGSYLEGGGVSELWKPKDGRNLLRILPVGGVLPSDWHTPYPFLIMGVHPNVGLSLNEVIYCPRLTHSKACPICNFAWNLYNSKADDDKALSKRIRSYRRVLANIIDINDIEKGVQKFGFGKKLAEKLLSYREDPEYGDFLSPETGRNFVLIKKTVDNYPNYDDSRPELKVTPLSTLYPNWKAECHDLTNELVAKSYEEMMQILMDTKKALLSTSPNEFGGGPAATARHSADAMDGVHVVELTPDDLKSKLDNI